ncbi:MAG: class C beta-lactamase-related serine hydrolase [Calditrichaeota bacterium]|nr:MAG: class C beta-lactamase-related serine hydrolase [Calditrichota bacterium]
MGAKDGLLLSSPEAEGISSTAIVNFVQAVEEQVDALHSFMLLRHGKIVAQGWWNPYNASTPHMLYSLSKSFTSTAIGLAIAEGRLSIDDQVISFFPDETPTQVSDNLKAMRIRDLLAMNTGHQFDTTGKLWNSEVASGVAAFLSLPVEHKPGTHFVYNSGATYMLSAIINKVTGTSLLEYLQPRLFAPLGIDKPKWESDPQGINFGGWGLYLKTEDIAKFGQLYLQKGWWKGQQIVPESWVAAATSRQTSNGSNPESDWEQGYGYQFWRCRHNIYRGDGAFGQYCIVMPDQDAVLAITGGVGDMQKPMNLVWNILLPAMEESPVVPDFTVAAALEKKLLNLGLLPVSGEVGAKYAKSVSGATYVFEQNDQGLKSVSFDMKKNPSCIVIRDDKGEHVLFSGYGTWVAGTTDFAVDAVQSVAASGAWTASNQYLLKLCYYETPYVPQFLFQFQDQEVHLTVHYNVSFGDRKWVEVVGKKL